MRIVNGEDPDRVGVVLVLRAVRGEQKRAKVRHDPAARQARLRLRLRAVELDERNARHDRAA